MKGSHGYRHFQAKLLIVIPLKGAGRELVKLI